MKRVGGTFVFPGPETLVIFGVHVKVLSALFGVVGVCAGHAMGPVPTEPLGFRRQLAVIVAGLFVSIAITIATGQRPLMVLGWAIGVGFAGITLYQGWGERARALGGSAAAEAIGDLLDMAKGRPLPPEDKTS